MKGERLSGEHLIGEKRVARRFSQKSAAEVFLPINETTR
jgi:hypothetical protein